jgi:purine-nucleoside phosphorylase
MSTVPEAIVARQCGLRVAAVSCITNPAAGRTRRKISHQEVLATGHKAGLGAARLLENFARLHAHEAAT